MSPALIVAGGLGVLGAAIHGIAGELLVVRKLSPDRLPATRFGGARMTYKMIHVTWHITSMAFLSVGAGLLIGGTVLHGEARQTVAYLAAVTTTVFCVVVFGLGGSRRDVWRSVLRHPAPVLLSATAALAWLGAG